MTNVVVRNCRLATGANGVKFGTGSYGLMRGVNIHREREDGGWAIADVKTNALYLARLHQAVREMIAQNSNHPCVMVWGVYNELYSVWDGDGVSRHFAKCLEGVVCDG